MLLLAAHLLALMLCFSVTADKNAQNTSWSSCCQPWLSLYGQYDGLTYASVHFTAKYMLTLFDKTTGMHYAIMVPDLLWTRSHPMCSYVSGTCHNPFESSQVIQQHGLHQQGHNAAPNRASL